ncbi:hypothetical protein LPW26_01175 [Rhodopseudomonas sp. HC1]|uniref:hypothetical protein n=1 Tax=Rhodopseudomonas infernalis TaxID=2897386 RepID=UPI001EE8829F|nr:hypothetical protein [Rhodopseudomonas infernalis]MCG6203235.1 hypothetical protein [Rhodopseudomonas infernalis]
MISQLLSAGHAALSFGGAGFAASAQSPKDPLWNSYHLAQLPLEIQRNLAAQCPSGSIAGHYFATYTPATIVLHYEYLGCRSGVAALCRNGQYLRQVYRAVGGQFRLKRSYFAAAYQ